MRLTKIIFFLSILLCYIIGLATGWVVSGRRVGGEITSILDECSELSRRVDESIAESRKRLSELTTEATDFAAISSGYAAELRKIIKAREDLVRDLKRITNESSRRSHGVLN